MTELFIYCRGADANLKVERNGLKGLTICQTCMMLSSDTEQITHGSFGFQEKSEILAVWPPWIN